MLLAAAIQTVHTTGINWESIAAIAGTTIAGLTFLDYRQTKKQNAVRSEIKGAVENLSEVLSARLETKEQVSALRERVAKLEGEQSKP